MNEKDDIPDSQDSLALGKSKRRKSSVALYPIIVAK